MTADRQPGSERFGDRWAIAALAAIITILFADVLLLGANLYRGDIATFHFGLKSIVRDALLQGALPEWNPWIGGGQPLAANPQYEVFYPPQWLILLPSYLRGFQLHVVLHLYVAAIGMYLLLRELKISVAGASFGALSFAVGGLTLSHLAVLPLLFALSWMPLVLVGARRYVETGGKRSLVLAAAALAMQLVIGEPTIVIQTLLLGGGWVLLRMAAPPSAGDRGRTSLRLAAIVGLGVALSAVQLVPTLDFARDTVRAAPFPWQVVRLWSFPVTRLLELLNPQALATTDPGGSSFFWASDLYPDRGRPFYGSIYPGLLVTLLAAAGVIARVRGWMSAMVVVAGSILIAAGDHTPLLRFLYDLGPAASLRYFEKFVTLAVFVLIVFSARAFDALVAGDRRVVRATIFASLAAAGTGATLALLPDESASRLFVLLGGPPRAAHSVLVDRMASSWIVAAACAAAICLFALALLQLPRLIRLAPLILLAFTTVDLGTRVTALAPREGAELFTPPSIARSIPPGERLWQEADWLDESELARAYQRLIPRSHVAWLRRNSLAFVMPPAWGIPTVLGIDVDETALRPTEDLLDTFWEARRRKLPGWPEPFLSMSGAARRTVYRAPERALAESAGRIESLIPISIVATEAAQRYAFAAEIVETRSREEFLQKLDGTERRGTAYLDMQPFGLGKGAVLAARELSDAIEIEVRVSEAPGLLTLAVTPHRYWRATIDGDAATLHRSNIGYMALVVPPGARTVRLVYRNPIVRPAAAVSLLAILISLALLLRKRARP